MGNGMSKRSHLTWTLPLVAIVGCIAVVAVRRGAAEPTVLDPSLVATARRSDLFIDVIETGKVQPREKVEIKSKVAGQGRAVAGKAGNRVRRGQLLLELDPLDSKRQLERALADVDAARNAYDFAALTV